MPSRTLRAPAARLGRWLVVAIPVGFVVVFFAYPLVTILGRGLAPDGSIEWGIFGEVLGSARFGRVLWFTTWQATVSTLLTLLLGLPGAYVIARYDFPGRRAVRALIIIPFVLPTVAVAAAFIALAGPTGPLGSLELVPSITAILVAHLFFNYAIVVRAVGAFWADLDPSVAAAAATLGASRWRVTREVTVPLLAPAIAAAAAIVFLFTFTSFGVVLLLGGAGRRTLEVEIYRQTVAFLDLPTAAVLVIVQVVAVSAVIAWLGRVQRRRAVPRGFSVARLRRPTSAGQWALVIGNLAAMAVLLGAPILVLVWRSLRLGGRFTFDSYRALNETASGTTGFIAPAEAIRNSIVFAVVATAIALVIGGLAAQALRHRGRGSAGLDVFLTLPLGTSAVTIGFGFLIALDSPPLDLRTSPLLIPLAHALVAIPFVVRLLLPAMRSVDTRMRDAAAVLGAGPMRVWREVELPVVGRAALVAAGFAFAVSLGEFGATAFIVRPDYPTVPVAIFRALGRPGPASFGQAAALAVILMILVAVAVAIADRWRVRDVGDF